MNKFCRHFAFSFLRSLLLLSLVAGISLPVGAYQQVVDSDSVLQHDLTMLNQRIEQDGAKPELELQRGILLTRLGRNSEAKSLFEGLRQQYPEQPAPYVNLAALLVREGALEPALEMLKLALERAPGKQSILESLANIHLGLAWKHLKQATSGSTSRATEERLAAIEVLMQGAVEKPSPRLVLADEGGATTDQAGFYASASGQEIFKVIENWRLAWESRNTEAYLGFYRDDFVSEKGESREQWGKRKRRIFDSVSYINVRLKILGIENPTQNQAKVRLVQSYRSSSHSGSDRKVLLLAKVGGEWKIISEMRTR